MAPVTAFHYSTIHEIRIHGRPKIHLWYGKEGHLWYAYYISHSKLKHQYIIEP